MSETALARAVHLLTWVPSRGEMQGQMTRNGREHGGGSMGSIFYGRSLDAPAPTALDWVAGRSHVPSRAIDGLLSGTWTRRTPCCFYVDLQLMEANN